MKHTLVRLGLLALTISTLVGCGGGGGGGSDGAPGPQGASGKDAIITSGTAVSVAALSSAQFADLQVQGEVVGVTINSPPEVTFKLADASGNAIAGLENNTTQTSTALAPSYSNVAFSIAKLVPGANGNPSRWVSYIVTSMPNKTTASVPARPTTDNTGTLTYLGDGQYKYKFYRDIKLVKAAVAAATETATNKNADLDDLSFDPTLTHRVVIQIAGNARGTGTNTADGVQVAPAVPLKNPVDIIYDFIPATGQPVTTANTQREIVKVSACAECHNKFTFHGGNALTGVGGSRQDTRMCTVCHTDQRKYGRAEATTTATGYTGTVYRIDGKSALDLPTFIHKIHMGEELTKTGVTIAGVTANEIRYPQLITNCTKCHDGTPTAKNATAQGDNWKTVPNIAACGACHDGVNFATGQGTTLSGKNTGHGAGGAQADNSKCSSCHTAAAIATSHVAVTPQDMTSSMFQGGTNNNTNAAWIASNHDNLPEGAIKVTYDIKSVSRNSSKQPVMMFRMKQNGTAVAFNDPTKATEIWDNFMGAPSVYFVFAVPQDGITAPADFNASASSYLRSLWNGAASGASAGTLTGPDTSGYYTATLTGVTIPDTAVMLTGGLGYSYAPKTTMPLTQTNLEKYPVTAATGSGLTAGMPNKTGGLLVVAPDFNWVATGYTGRRAIVEDARCNNCHKELGVFNKSSFHAGQRNDGSSCSWCHTPNRTSSGWAADSTNFVHAIHGGLKRTNKFTWHASSTESGYWKIGYPGVLKNCEACHLPGTYDFSATASASAVSNRLYRTAATGTFSSTATDLVKFAYSPFVKTDTSYGAGFSFSATTGVTTAAADTTLVESPITTVCFACHDSTLARTHMESNGGSIYVDRKTALAKPEQCMICHESGRVGDIKTVHSR